MDTPWRTALTLHLTAGIPNDRLQTSKGEPTAGIFGFANVLMRLLEQERPEYLAVAFDTGQDLPQ